MSSPRSASRRHVVVGAPIYEQSSVFGAHVSYAVASCTAQSRGACVCVRRRFTDFRALAASLERRYPGLKGHLPESSLLGGLFADPTESRAAHTARAPRADRAWLDAACEHRYASSRDAVVEAFLKVAPYGEWERLRAALLRSDEDDARVACQTLRADQRRDEDPRGPGEGLAPGFGRHAPGLGAARHRRRPARVETAAAAAARAARRRDAGAAPRRGDGRPRRRALRALADAERDVFRDHAKGGASLKRCGDALEAEAAELAAAARRPVARRRALHREAVLIGALRREAKRVEQAERKLKPDDDARGRSDSDGFDKSKLDAADAPAAPAPGRGPPPMPASNPMAAAIAARRASMRNASDSD
ncbi:hypothetical protein SO694_00023130 [Aureococcus anophagefferens]|uniref:PX domain-containing protein n=1 Tax=Aureococcus anophagefferens TaxID=44056 RepID=A0ABR1FTN5_AURAN